MNTAPSVSFTLFLCKLFCFDAFTLAFWNQIVQLVKVNSEDLCHGVISEGYKS